MFKVIPILCLTLPVILGIPITGPQDELDDNTLGLFPDIPDPITLAKNQGYRGTNHKVFTKDGYILTINRITSPKHNFKPNKPAVLLLHGLLDCSATWLLADPTRSLAYTLSDLGYDVWLGNVRGNRYSREHKSLSLSDPEYWKFSWHEMGIYDLPAMIDYICEETNQEKIFLVGHSQGTTAYFVMISELPEYQDKLIAEFALAPVTFMGHMTNNFFRILARYVKSLKGLTELIGLHEFKPTSKFIQTLGKKICQEDHLLEPLCQNVFFLVAGWDPELNKTLAASAVQYDPAGASVMQFTHYAQLINSGKFQQYDHGLIRNLKTYGKIHPPEYNLDNVRMPVYLHYSENDVFVHLKDLEILSKKIPTAHKMLVTHKLFGHVDFIWGKDVDVLLNNDIVKLMENHTRNEYNK